MGRVEIGKQKHGEVSRSKEKTGGTVYHAKYAEGWSEISCV